MYIEGAKMTIDDGEKSPTYANMKMLGFSTDLNASSPSSPEELYKEFHTNMSQFREPPPYPGHSKQQQQQPQPTQGGLRQSFSGSEASTDISSTENLSSCQRQEPQGEETQAHPGCLSYDTPVCNSEYSILARLGMPTSSLDTLQCANTNTPQIYVTGNSSHGPHFATSPSLNTSHTGQGYYMSSESGFASASTSSSKLTWQDTTPTNQTFYSDQSPSTTAKSNMSSPVSVSSYSSNTLYANYPFTNISAMEPIQVPSGPMLPQYLTSLPPPPEYPGIRKPDLLCSPEAKRSYETIMKPEVPGSRSQPDLTNFWDSHSQRLGMFPSGSGSDEGSHNSAEQLNFTDPRYQDVDQIATQATRMVNVLTEENKSLREKLFIYEGKVSKLQKFELEIQKIYNAYEALVRSSKKQEYLHLAMKKRLDDDLKSLRGQNEGLRRQLDNAGVNITDQQFAQMDSSESNMVYLLSKHKEVLCMKERQEMELVAQRATIQEQRAQIDILRTVQANVQRLEEECHRQQILSDSVDKLQQELTDVKTAYGHKEQTERNIRQKLERDLEYCRRHHSQGTLARKADGKRDNTADTKRLLDEKEANILSLEKELIKWKEQHVEEQIRKLKLQEQETSSEPSLPSYEQASPMNTESLINEAKTEKLKQMEEVYQANRKVAELDARVKSLQSQLQEKDAIVRVYQRSPMTRSSSVHTIYCTPHHSPRPSLIASGGKLSRQNSQDATGLLDIRHMKTGSSPALEAGRKRHLSEDDLLEKIQNLQSQSKSSSDTEELTEKTIWQV